MRKTIFILILPIFLLAGCGKSDGTDPFANYDFEVKNSNDNRKILINQPPSQTTTVEIATPPAVDVKIKKPTTTGEVEIIEPGQLPAKVDYLVPFAPQAPYAVWDELHKEACEEAAMIIAAKYFKKEPLSPHLMEQAILNLIKWEKENGYKIDLTAQEAAKILRDYFGLRAELETEVTVERIKEILAEGKLIIVPAAGRMLKNPYFQRPGPIYHMLVIRGYEENYFITNDPGTKRGEGFKYKYQTLINAVHDWNHQFAEGGMTEEEIEKGEKVMIVVGNK